jgi:tetratricopeptide (TPR) repeat protein
MRKLLILLALLALAVPLLAQEATEVPEEDPCPAGDSTYYVGVGNAFYDSDAFALAIDAYNCALELDPDYVRAYVERGFAYAAQGNFEQALEEYTRALDLDETLVEVYNNRGLTYATQGNFGLALTDFDLAVALDPEYAPAYHNRAVIHAAEQNYDLATADFEAAIAADPNYPDPHAGLAAVYNALSAIQYETFYEKAGTREARLPAGTPAQVMGDVVDSRLDGSSGVWLRLLDPSR